MRDLTDAPTWEDDLSGIGPEIGDPGNGEEVSVIGDKLGNRTRWARAAVYGTYQLIDFVESTTATFTTVAAPTSTTYVNFGTLTGNVVLALGDIIEVFSEYHWYTDGSGNTLRLTHATNITPGGLETLSDAATMREYSSGQAGFVQQTSWSSTFAAVAGQVGYVAQIKHRAKLTGAGTDIAVLNPSLRRVKVFRKVTT